MKYSLQVLYSIVTIIIIVSDLIKDSDELTFSIISNPNPQVVNLQKIINDQLIISFQTKERSIKFTINNNNIPIGNGEYTFGNETRWLTVNSSTNKKKGENFTLNLIDCMRLKIHCTITQSDTNSQQLRESNNSSTKKSMQASMKAQVSKRHTSISCNAQSAKANKINSSQFSNHSKQNDTKKMNNSNLKHNKSYEDGFETNNLLLTELSPRKQNDSFNKKTSYVHPRNINNYKGLSSTKHQIGKGMNHKYFGNKRNKSYENVSHRHRSDINYQSFPKKIKEGVKVLDTMVLEKNYETNIKREDLTSGVHDNKKGIFRITLEKGNNKTEDIVTQSGREDRDQREESFVLSTNQFEDETDRTNFSHLKDDFEILYTKDYVKTIPKEMIRLEFQLLIENICELQDAYHKEIANELTNYSKYKELFSNYSEKYLLIFKKQLKLKGDQEKAHVMNIFHTFINNHKLKHSKELLSISKKEIGLWNKVPMRSNIIKLKEGIEDNNQTKNKSMLQSIGKGIMLKYKHLVSDYHIKLYDRVTNKNTKHKPVNDNDIDKTLFIHNYQKGSNNSKANQGGNSHNSKNHHKIHSLHGNH